MYSIWGWLRSYKDVRQQIWGSKTNAFGKCLGIQRTAKTPDDCLLLHLCTTFLRYSHEMGMYQTLCLGCCFSMLKIMPHIPWSPKDKVKWDR